MWKDPLDKDVDFDPPLKSVEIVKWWERKRLIFNLVLILSFVGFTYIVSKFEMKHYVWDHLKTAFFAEIILGNLAYCGLWTIELLFNFYSKITNFNTEYRWGLFCVSILLTIIVSFFAVDAVIDFRFI